MEIWMMDFVDLLLIFLIGIFSGVIGTLVGGAGSITIPAFIILGLSPQSAIGTSLFGFTGMNVAGWYKFHQKRMIDYKIGFIVGIPSLIGSILGATLVLKINATILQKVIAVITILTLSFISLRPKMGIEKADHMTKKRDYFTGIILSFFIGIYTGFYGAVAGTFLTYMLIVVFKQTFLESTATRKISFTFSSVAAAIIFVINAAVFYPWGVVLFISTSLGAYISAHYSDKIGNIWIKRLFIIVVLVMAIKLLL